MKRLEMGCGDSSIQPLKSWGHLKGNPGIYRKFVGAIRHAGLKSRVVLTGPAGSGKSAIVNHAIAAEFCDSPHGGDPCGQCGSCRQFEPGETAAGLFRWDFYQNDNPGQVQYIAVNCRRLTHSQLMDKVGGLGGMAGKKVIHLEEALGLVHNRLDLAITALMDAPDYIETFWVATCVNTKGLDEQFLRRFTLRLKTTPVPKMEIATLLAERCRKLEIAIDHPSTWELLAERCHGVVGRALAAIDQARFSDPPRLTRELVEEYSIDWTDPWHI